MNRVINYFGISGGKDSTALWGWAIFESGYPKESIRGTFADTGNEYDEVYEQVSKLSKIGIDNGLFPIVTLYPKRSFLELAKWKTRFPSAKARFCTEHLKMIPCRNYIRYWMWLEGDEVLCHSGVRASESDERAQLDEIGFDNYLGTTVRRPLLKWSISDVWEAHKRFGLPINPLYLKGRKRVGCRLCCMSSKEDVRQTVIHKPWVIDVYRGWESEVGKCNSHGMATFFGPNTIPDIQCSKIYTNRHGEVFRIGTIDDVARWSQTLRGGTQSGFGFMWEEDDDFDGGLACNSVMGHCE